MLFKYCHLKSYSVLSLCLFLSVCFHAVKGISLEPTYNSGIMATFVVSGCLIWAIYFELPICLWNKFDKKVQCEAVLSVVSLISKLVWTYSIVIYFFFQNYWIFFPGFLEKQYCLIIIRFKMCQNEIQIIASPAFLREVAH